MSSKKSAKEFPLSEISVLHKDGCTEVSDAIEFRIPQRDVFIKALFPKPSLSCWKC